MFLLQVLIVLSGQISHAKDLNCKEYFYFISAKQMDSKTLIQKRSDVFFVISLAELSVRMSRANIASLNHKLNSLQIGRSGYEESYQRILGQIEHASRIMKRHMERLNSYKRQFELINRVLDEKASET